MLLLKKISIYSLLLCSLLAASCTKENGGGGNEGGETGGEAYISFSVSTGFVPSGTKASVIDGLDWGTPEESYVEKVRVILYADNPFTGGIRSEHIFDFKIRTRETGDAPNPDWEGFVEEPGLPSEEQGTHLHKSGEYDFTTVARKVQRKVYYAQVILNPTDALYTLTNDSDHRIDQYESAETSILPDDLRVRANGGIAGDNYFLMTNHQGTYIITPAELMPTEEEAHAEPVSIKVSRAVSKVEIDVTPPAVTESGAQADNYSWELDVTNKWTYWLRQMTDKITQTGIPGEAEEPEDFDFSDEAAILKHLKTLYAHDRNFSRQSQYNGGSSSARAENFNYISNNTTDLQFRLGEAQYCLENTMEGEEQFEDVITSVVIRCRYTPNSYTPGESYFVFSGYLISVPQMQGYVDDDSSIPAVLQNLKLGESIVQAKTAGHMPDQLSTLSASFESYSIKYYHEGINYYRMLIEHTGLPSSGLQTEPGRFYGRYGVVRNNLYTIKLNSIKGPGSPVSSSASMRNIAGQVNMLDWYERSTGVEIN